MTEHRTAFTTVFRTTTNGQGHVSVTTTTIPLVTQTVTSTAGNGTVVTMTTVVPNPTLLSPNNQANGGDKSVPPLPFSC